MDLSPTKISFICCLLITSYLAHLCFTPPNPTPESSAKIRDRFGKSRQFRKVRMYVGTVLGIYHIFLALFPDDRATMCLHPEYLNEDLYSWSKFSAFSMLVVLVAAPIRLLAYSQLGKNFTFGLAKPTHLIKTGMYRYVQHPSYTTLFMIICSIYPFIFRLDGTPACFLPEWLVRMTWISKLWLSHVVLVMSTLLVMRARVEDEEDMLKGAFGEEWVEYNRTTKRFIPGVI